MAFCSSCGLPIDPKAKFCSECGATNVSSVPAGAVTSEPANSTRVEEYKGKITKCPSCGEILKALSAKCPTCGFELREIEQASSVKEFSEKLNKTISSRERINLIQNYPIPNAKEDIFEFLVLATTNFDTKKHFEATGTNRELSDAWLTKIEQSYVKAETLFKNDKDFGRFQEIYDSDMKELEAAKQNQADSKYYGIGTILMLCAAGLSALIMLKGSGIVANPRLDITIVAFFVLALISYIYPKNKNLKIVMLIGYILNVLLNIGFCLVAPGHLFHIFILVACALWAFVNKKQLSKK